MKKYTVKSSRSSVVSFVSFFLLFFSIGLLIFQQLKLPKEVNAVPGDIIIGAGASGAGCGAGELIMGGGVNTKSGCGNFASSFTDKTPKFAGLLTTGNVGIGTTSPQAQLDVIGNVNISVGGGASPLSFLETTDSQRYRFSPMVTGLRLQARNFDGTAKYDLINFRWDANEVTIPGNVGIGTTSPSAKLHLYTNTAATNNELWIEGGASSTYWPTLKLKDGRTSGGDWNIETGRNLGNLEFYTGAYGTVMSLKNNGNVGIGTTSPAYTLDVHGVVRASSEFRMDDAEVCYGSPCYPFRIVTTPVSAGNGAANLMDFYVSNGTHAGTDPSSNDSVREARVMTLNGAGNVGIGTTSPSQKLEVYNGNIRVSQQDSNIELVTGGGGANDLFGGRWRVHDTGSGATGYVSYDTKNSGTWTNDQLTIVNSTGNVGIGTTAPGYKLDVNGTAEMNALSINGTGVTATGAELNILHGATGLVTADLINLAGVTGGIQSQIDSKAPLASPTLTGNVFVYNNATLGSELVDTWTNSVTYPYETFTLSGSSITSAINDTTGYGIASKVISIQQGRRYRATFTLTLNSGAAPTFSSGTSGGSGYQFQQVTVAGANTMEWTSTRTGTEYINWVTSSGVATNYSVSSFSLKEIIGGNINIAGLYTGGGTSGIKVDSAGNVGIGTTAPGAKLDVNGTTALRDNVFLTSNKNLYFWPDTSGSYITGTAASGLYFRGGGGLFNFSNADVYVENDLHVVGAGPHYFSAGNVGIGTTTPGTKLDVQGGDIRTSGNVRLGATNNNGIQFWDSSSFAIFFGNTSTYDRASVTDYHTSFTMDGSANRGWTWGVLNQNPIASLNSNTGEFTVAGNVGIGTTAPVSKLSVGGAGTAATAVYGTYAGGYGVYGVGNTGGYGVFGTSDTGFGVGGISTSGYGGYFSSTSGYALITGTGSVGIGTTAPLSQLSVGGPGAANFGIYSVGPSGGIAIFGSASTPGGVGVYGSGTGSGVSGSGSGSGVSGSGGTYGVSGSGVTGVSGSGSTTGVSGVGSGNGGSYGVYGSVTGTGINYGVYGSAGGAAAFGIYCQATLNVGGCAGNRAWTPASDARLKKDIVTIPHALDKVMHLRGVDFNWIDGGQADMGFIAQEVLPIIPEVVSLNTNTGMYGVRTSQLTGLLVEAIKEQQTQIVSLQSITTDFIGKFKEGLIETKKLIVDGVDILKRINELSDKSDKQQQTIEAQQKQNDAQQKQIDDLKKTVEGLKK